jgi:putative ABC transport system permease protein
MTVRVTECQKEAIVPDQLMRNVRYAARSLRRDSSFTLAAVITLALGIGAVTALFTVLDGVLLKPLAYADPVRTVAVINRFADRSIPQLTGGDFIDIGRTRDGFEKFAYYYGGELGVQVSGHAEFVGVRIVHPEFFDVFGVPAAAGRTFAADDAERTAIVGRAFAERNFGSVAAALTQRVFVESRQYDIVGVMPEVMRFPANTEVWVAGALEPPNRNRSGHNYRAVGRLAAGVTLDNANARLAALASRLAAAYPTSNKDKAFVAMPLRDSLVSDARTTLYVLMAAVVLVLLIACANVANLMLARSAARAREISIRSAIGASRHHLVGELLIESLLLAAIACGLGVALAYAGTQALLSGGTPSVPLPRLSDVHMDWRVLAFSVGVSVITILAFGLAPALQAARADGKEAMLRAGARGAAGHRSRTLRNGLVVAQIALAYVLSVNAALLLRSFVALTDAPLGFRTDNVLVMYAHAPARGSIFNQSGIDDYLRVGRLFDDVLARVRQQPDVVSAGAAMGLPTGQYNSNGAYAVDGKHSFDGDFRKLPQAGLRLASPGYFATLGIPVLRGRDFTEGDVYEQPAVAIISQSLARETFPGEDPIGQRIKTGLDRPDVWMTIVGVAGDVRQASPASRPGPELYMPLRQHPYAANEVQLVVRGRNDPAALAVTVQKIVRTANAEVAMKFLTLDESVGKSIAAPRLRATLVSTFASLALLLAIAGVYAVISYTTAQRTPEFGLRVAIGASTADILRLVLGGAGGLALMGITAGLLLTLVTSRVIAAMLFGVTHTDATTYLGVFAATLPLVIAAAAIPAWRAARVDPVTALRAE